MVKLAVAILVVACGIVVAPLARAADDVSERAYALPGHGAFVLAVPSAWRHEIGQPKGDIPPTITFRPADGRAFSVMVTPIWPAKNPLAGYNSPDTIRALVEDSAHYLAKSAAEQSFEVVPIGGMTGFYFSATDSSLVGRTPPPDEYLYLIQGIAAVDDLLCTFTILTNDAAAPIDLALQMLRTAAHSNGG